MQINGAFYMQSRFPAKQSIPKHCSLIAAVGMLCVAISEPRVARSGKELPSARLVSSIVHPDTDDPDYLHTLVLMVMGQFVDHDVSLLAISMIADSGFDDDLEGQFFSRRVSSSRFSAFMWSLSTRCVFLTGSMSYLVGSLDLEGASGYVSSVTEMADVECGDDGCQTDGPENRECYPIFVPHIDTVFGGHKRCLMFVRSLGVPSENCTPGSFTDSKLFICIRFQDSDVANGLCTCCRALYSASSVNRS